MNGIGIIKFNSIIRDDYTFDNKRGINPKISRLFTRFLESNPNFLKVVAENRYKVFTPKNICGGILRPPVNCKDNVMMIREGLRPPRFIINKDVFAQSAEQKELVKTLKRTTHLSTERSVFRDIHRKPQGCLIVHVKNKHKLPKFKTTHNYKCAEHEVRDLLNVFHEKQLVTKVMFNGKEVV